MVVAAARVPRTRNGAETSACTGVVAAAVCLAVTEVTAADWKRNVTWKDWLGCRVIDSTPISLPSPATAVNRLSRRW